MPIDHRCHILHVTENDADSRLFSEIAQKSPSLLLHRVKSAAEVFDILRQSQKSTRPNLLLIDWSLSEGRGGAELLTALKADRTFKSIPVLVFVNVWPQADLDRIYGLGASCVVTRELSPEAFADSVELVCRFWGDIASLPYCDPAKPATA
jgi:CheY-like chemotaxis protein